MVDVRRLSVFQDSGGEDHVTFVGYLRLCNDVIANFIFQVCFVFHQNPFIDVEVIEVFVFVRLLWKVSI